MELQKRTANVQEFADILGVDRTTVTKAISTKRLDKAIVKGSSPKRIEVFAGCVEWYLKKQVERDRYAQEDQDVKKSKARHEYYRSLLTKLEYEVKRGHLLPLEEVRQKGMEICLNARRYLDDRRDSDALVLPTFKDDFEARKILRDRDDRFMERLVELEKVGDEVSKENAQKLSTSSENIADKDESDDDE